MERRTELVLQTHQQEGIKIVKTTNLGFTSVKLLKLFYQFMGLSLPIVCGI